MKPPLSNGVEDTKDANEQQYETDVPTPQKKNAQKIYSGKSLGKLSKTKKSALTSNDRGFNGRG